MIWNHNNLEDVMEILRRIIKRTKKHTYLADGVDHEQQLQRLAHRDLGGRGQEGEVRGGLDAQNLQLQQHLRDVGALDFRQRCLLQLVVRFCENGSEGERKYDRKLKKENNLR